MYNTSNALLKCLRGIQILTLRYLQQIFESPMLYRSRWPDVLWQEENS